MISLRDLIESTLRNAGLSASTAPFESLGNWDNRNGTLWFGDPYNSPHVRLTAAAVPAKLRRNNTLFSMMIRAGENPSQSFEAVELESIAVPDSQQGQGLAKRILTDITSRADANNIWMWLEAVPFGNKTMATGKLVDFYESMGFRTITLGARPVMVRAPRKAPNNPDM
jgi:GNAT superfamily N-acetyltransferase